MILLSRLLLTPRNGNVQSLREEVKWKQELDNLGREGFGDLAALAQSNHVMVRGLSAYLRLVREQGATEQVQQAERALAREQARIQNAICFLQEICAAFQEQRYGILVIKSLDHWPDIGSDLDLFTNAQPDQVSRLMTTRFSAQIAGRSWGDRLANKWNFLLPELTEPVEIHVRRLGQTGEQAAMASSLVERARWVHVSGWSFRVASISDRLMISTLQRMYRHFNLRLCDVVDTTLLADAGAIDYENLRSLAGAAGIWEGVATYLQIVSDYVRSYRGTGIDLPKFVAAAARFGGDDIYYGKGFLRVPIMPHSAMLYGSQLAGVFARGELGNGARLTLLPWLATAAAAKEKLTGSDKGIW